MYSIVKVIVNAIAVTLDYTIDLLLLNVFMLLLLISTEIKSCFFLSTMLYVFVLVQNTK